MMQVVRLREQQPDHCQMDKCCTGKANKSCNSTPAGMVSATADIHFGILQDQKNYDSKKKKKKQEQEDIFI